MVMKAAVARAGLDVDGRVGGTRIVLTAACGGACGEPGGFVGRVSPRQKHGGS